MKKFSLPAIYCLYNYEDDRYYIGQAGNVGKRRSQHKTDYMHDHLHHKVPQWMKDLKASNPDRHFEKDFKFTILESFNLDVDPMVLDEREKYWIARYIESGKKLYNIRSGGEVKNRRDHNFILRIRQNDMNKIHYEDSIVAKRVVQYVVDMKHNKVFICTSNAAAAEVAHSDKGKITRARNSAYTIGDRYAVFDMDLDVRNKTIRKYIKRQMASIKNATNQKTIGHLSQNSITYLTARYILEEILGDHDAVNEIKDAAMKFAVYYILGNRCSKNTEKCLDMMRISTSIILYDTKGENLNIRRFDNLLTMLKDFKISRPDIINQIKHLHKVCGRYYAYYTNSDYQHAVFKYSKSLDRYKEYKTIYDKYIK